MRKLCEIPTEVKQKHRNTSSIHPITIVPVCCRAHEIRRFHDAASVRRVEEVWDDFRFSVWWPTITEDIWDHVTFEPRVVQSCCGRIAPRAAVGGRTSAFVATRRLAARSYPFAKQSALYVE